MKHKHKNQQREVPIINASTGATHMSAPVAVHSPRDVLLSNATSESSLGNSEASARDRTQTDEVQLTKSEPKKETGSAGSGKDTKATGSAKPKVDVETFEQFIEYAYKRKGQPLTLKPALEKQVAQNLRTDFAAENRLMTQATKDELLAVPRQILLFSRDVDGFPALRAALCNFVYSVMLRHPVFEDAGVQGVLRNLPDAQPIASALAKVMAFTPPEKAEQEPLTNGEVQALRRNAANLFAAWLASNRSMNSDELVTLLFKVVWEPAARKLEDDNARLRALTELDEPAGVGLACMRLRQQAIDARSAQDQAQREANDLRSRLAEVDRLRIQAEEQRDALHLELEKLQVDSSAEMAEMRAKHEVERTHLSHDLEQLRGRMVRRLDEGVEMLDVGLTALRNKTPRVEVMLERAEHVVETLRSEIKNLRED